LTAVARVEEIALLAGLTEQDGSSNIQSLAIGNLSHHSNRQRRQGKCSQKKRQREKSILLFFELELEHDGTRKSKLILFDSSDNNYIVSV
jgi:hypothetical protein